MIYLKIFKLALKALSANKIRSVLTALGIIVGTAIVVIVLSVGEGIKYLILSQLSSITSDTVYVEIQIPSKGTRTQKDANTGQGIATGIQITTLTIKDLEDVLKIPNVRTGYAMIMGQNKFTYKNNNKTALYWAVDDNYAQEENLKISEGRFYTQEENDSLKHVVVLGADIKEILFARESAIGKSVKIGNASYKVVGVAAQIGMQFFMNMDEMVYIPTKTAQKKLLGQNHIQAMALKLDNANLLSYTSDQIERIIRNNHNIKDPEKDDFVIRTMDESMEMIDQVTDGIAILLFAIASVSLIVGGVGIMNVMYVSVTERTQEIGLKKALGAKPYAIKFQFIIEAVVLSAIGGLLGVLGGMGFAWAVSVIASYFNFDWPFIISLEAYLFALYISVILGILFGYAPAKQASSLNPIESLTKP